MKKILHCRRSSLALIAMACLTSLGLVKGQDVALALAGVVTAIAAANASESAYRSRNVKGDERFPSGNDFESPTQENK